MHDYVLDDTSSSTLCTAYPEGYNLHHDNVELLKLLHHYIVEYGGIPCEVVETREGCTPVPHSEQTFAGVSAEEYFDQKAVTLNPATMLGIVIAFTQAFEKSALKLNRHTTWSGCDAMNLMHSSRQYTFNGPKIPLSKGCVKWVV